MKVSVIIPVYRKQKYLKECLLSLKKQSFKDFEVVVVNDDNNNKNLEIKNFLSASKTQKIKTEFKIKNLKLINQKHQGPAIARNNGVKYTRGEILIFVDADMIFEQNFIKELIQPIIEGKAKGTFSKNEYVANWENVWARCWNYNLNLPERKRLPNNYPNLAPVFRAILKSEFQKVGGFSPKGYDDDWSLSEKLGYQAQAVKGAVYYHYNPVSLGEVFNQARWQVKRNYKGGILGELINLVFLSLPFSIIIGIFKAIFKKEPRFLIFKIIFDLGAFLGLLEKILFKKLY